MASDVEKIKEKLDITEIVGSYVKLQKAGVNYKALCPFHAEKTPSFYVTPSRQIWHCFGCNAGGDIFRFVQNIEGIEFPEALRLLADKAGVVLERQDPKLRNERTRLLELMETATSFYEKNLYERKDVGAYLKERGMTGETAKHFRLGYAFNSWDAIFDHLKEKGFRPEEIEKAGLVVKSDKLQAPSSKLQANYYDRFRARVMFPIFDSAGRVVGFSGRIFEKDVVPTREAVGTSTSPSASVGAKYINTPQTILYDKSRVLYGLDRAKTEIRKNNTAIILEGQMDLIMSHQAGAINAVAVSGTALTSQHLSILKRLCDTLTMSFDADSAGFEATKKSVDLAMLAGFDIKIASSFGEKDPADMIKTSPSDWVLALQEAKPIVAYLLETLRKKNKDDLVFKKEVSSVVLPHIALIQNDLLKAHWVSKTAGALNVREESVWRELSKIRREGAQYMPAEMLRPSRTRRALLEERLIGLASRKSDFLKEFSECSPEWFSNERRHIFESAVSGAETADTHYVKKLALEAEVAYSNHDGLGSEILLLARELKKEHLKEKLNLLAQEARGLEEAGDKEKLIEKFTEFKAVSAELNSL